MVSPSSTDCIPTHSNDDISHSTEHPSRYYTNVLLDENNQRHGYSGSTNNTKVYLKVRTLPPNCLTSIAPGGGLDREFTVGK